MLRFIWLVSLAILIVSFPGCGGAGSGSSGSGTPPPSPQPLADFAIYLDQTKIGLLQGGSASADVALNFTTTGSSDFQVQFTVTGMPTGVQATFGENPFNANGPATGVTFTASANAELANFITVTVTATRASDGMQASSQLLMNVVAKPGSLPPIRTDFVRTDGTPAAVIYDSARSLVYASNPAWNRIDVISPVTRQIVNSIPAPSPTAMDMSLDGRHLMVATNVQEIVSVDIATDQVVKRSTVVPIVQGGASYAIPGLLANTSNGTLLVAMSNFSGPPTYYLEQWNPSAGTFTPMTVPGFGPYISQMVRTGDGNKVLIADYGSDLAVAVYDAPSNTFPASGQSPVGQILGVAANPTSEQFAIVGANGFAFVDASLNVLAMPQLGGYYFGMVYSPDGSKLYVAMELISAQCGVNYPVLMTFDTSSYSLLGVAPAFEEPTGSTQCSPPLYFLAEPQAADNSGLLFSTSLALPDGFTEGLVIDDAANMKDLLNLPEGPPYPQVTPGADEAALNATLDTGLGQIGFDVLPDIWFGNARGTNIDFSGGPLVSVTAPASSLAGIVNVKAVLPDGWFSLAPQAFSYGSKILFLGGTAGSTQGGESLAMVGYGLVGNIGSTPRVTIGGQPATVTAAGKYSGLLDSGYNASYPFQLMDEVIVTVPPGNPGTADVMVTSNVGTSNMTKAFTYVPVTDYPSSDSLTFVLYDSQRHRVYLSAGDHIDVFSTDTNQYLAPIRPPSLGGASLIRGLALTPDHTKLLAANFADISVAIMDPDDPSSGAAVKIPVTQANSPGVFAVAATSTGKAFVDGVSATFAGCGGELWEVDLNTLQASPRSDLPFPELQVGGNAFSRDASGDNVLLAGLECGTYLWNSVTDSFVKSQPLVSDGSTISADGYWLASDLTRLDAGMVERMQAQTREFFADYYANMPGEKMNASGSLLYTPTPQAVAPSESNGIQLTDTASGNWLGEVLLSEQIGGPQVQPMDFDEADNRLFVITDKGLTVVELPPVPLSIGYLQPATGSSSGGTSVTIRGSGFQPGATVSFGTTKTSPTVVDASTLQATTPAGVVGGTRVTIQNPDGTSYSLDAGFTYQ